MSKEKTVEKQNKNFLSGLFRQQIFIPIAALIILAVFNLIADPSFFKITLGYNSAGDPVLSGYLMTILDYGSELAILAIGMTLVTAAYKVGKSNPCVTTSSELAIPSIPLAKNGLYSTRGSSRNFAFT